MAELEQGSHDETKLRLALSQGQAPQPDTTAEDAASAASFGDQADIQDSFGDPGGGDPVEFNAIGDVLGNLDPNGIPYQVRFLVGGDGKIAKRQIYIPARPVVFNGDTITPSGMNLTLGAWNDFSATALYLEIKVDDSSGSWCDPKRYAYSKPTCTAKWQTAHTPAAVTETSVQHSIACATDIPVVAGGSVTSTRYKHVLSGSACIVDPFIHASHMVSMDVVTDIRFEDTGSEIKCHVTRAKCACFKLYNEDATPKEDYKNGSAQSDTQIQRVIKMMSTRVVSNGSYQGNALTQRVGTARVVCNRGGSDPVAMTAPQFSTETVFTTSPHSAEH